jgi:hypothetical protein
MVRFFREMNNMVLCEDGERIIYIWIYTRGKRRSFESNGAFSFLMLEYLSGKNYL